MPERVKRGGPLKRRTRLRPVSEKRKRQSAERARVRTEVLARDDGCRAMGLAPGPCGRITGRARLEVHELWPGAGRVTAWLDPDQCIAVCPPHHDWITDHPAEATKLGLLRRGWVPAPDAGTS